MNTSLQISAGIGCVLIGLLVAGAYRALFGRK